MKNSKNFKLKYIKLTAFGFTLVELLSVIIILGILLVIAIPKVFNMIKDVRISTLESTAKMIVISAENKNFENKVFQNNELIDCESVAKINDIDYANCSIKFVDDKAKVTIKGSGKYSGLYVCSGTKQEIDVVEETCSIVKLTVNLDGGTDSIDYEEKYEFSTKIELEEPVKPGYKFIRWSVSGDDAKVEENILTMGTTHTTVTAIWELKIMSLVVNPDGGHLNQEFKNEYLVGETILLEPPTREGYVFKGFDLVSGNGILSGNNFTFGDEDVVIKALWEGIKYEIIYNANGGKLLSIDFDNVGEESYLVPEEGMYRLEVWGAQGGMGMVDGVSKFDGGYGAYSKGEIYLNKGNELYITVGGKGEDASDQKLGGVGGCNGGGTGSTEANYSSTGKNEPGAGGGGATHISLKSGLLTSFSEDLDNLLIVAGGGGGSGYKGSGSSGGGSATTYGTLSTTCIATQDAGNLFGIGADGISANTGIGGGGGGFYGGCAGKSSGASGAGGSGYIGNKLLINKEMYCYDCEISSNQNDKTHLTEKADNVKKSNSAKIGDGGAVISSLTIKSEITYGDKYGAMPIPTREGYVFMGWYTELDGGILISESTQVSKIGKQEVYAKWLQAEPVTFLHKKEVQKFIATKSGYYQLEVWGAQGGTGMVNGKSKYTGGYGGYSKGIVYLNENDELYVYVGEKGEDALDQKLGGTGGYNGGGTGGTDSNYASSEDNEPGAGGGGATHITKAPKLLSEFTDNLDDLLIVAGGGGGSAYDGLASSGGGAITAHGTSTETCNATQFSGNLIGQGGTGISKTAGSGGGGGGLYGGCAGNDGGASGAGGSGYIGNTLLVNKVMYCYDCNESNGYSTKTINTTNVSEEAKTNNVKMGDGQAIITYLGDSVNLEEFTIDSFEEFTFLNVEQKYQIPVSGKYKLEVWGAEGGKGMVNGTSKYVGGYGAYASGIIYLNKNEELYINIGGKGENASDRKLGGAGGYNGGGTGGTDSNYDSAGSNEPGAGGGGATHIAKESGLLSTFSDKLNKLLIVAGGGGGSAYKGSGTGGGGASTTTGTSTDTCSATGESGNLFGIGGDGIKATSGSGGGGGGLYGGCSGITSGHSGAGGSGYIENDLLTNKIMYCYDCNESNNQNDKTILTTNISEIPIENYVKLGNGFAKITYVGIN